MTDKSRRERAELAAPFKNRAPMKDRRMSDPWRDEVDSTLRFLRKGHITLTKEAKETKQRLAENTELTKKVGQDVVAAKSELKDELSKLRESTAGVVAIATNAKKGAQVIGKVAVAAGWLIRKLAVFGRTGAYLAVFGGVVYAVVWKGESIIVALREAGQFLLNHP